MSKINVYLVHAFDDNLDRELRRRALLEANSLRKSAKVGWAKLGMSQGQYDDLLELLSQPEVVEDDFDNNDEADRKLVLADMMATSDATIWIDGEAEVLISLVGPDVDVEITSTVELPKRGEVGRMVMLLLETTDLGYAQIVEMVRTKWPSAATTARSIASVAADMRRNGVEVASRRSTKV